MHLPAGQSQGFACLQQGTWGSLSAFFHRLFISQTSNTLTQYSCQKAQTYPDQAARPPRAQFTGLITPALSGQARLSKQFLHFDRRQTAPLLRRDHWETALLLHFPFQRPIDRDLLGTRLSRAPAHPLL